MRKLRYLLIICPLLFCLPVFCFGPSRIDNQTHFMTSCRLKMRDSPSLDGAVAQILEKYTQVEIMEEGPAAVIGFLENNWLKVKTQGKTGWVFGGYIIGKTSLEEPFDSVYLPYRQELNYEFYDTTSYYRYYHSNMDLRVTKLSRIEEFVREGRLGRVDYDAAPPNKDVYINFLRKYTEEKEMVETASVSRQVQKAGNFYTVLHNNHRFIVTTYYSDRIGVTNVTFFTVEGDYHMSFNIMLSPDIYPEFTTWEYDKIKSIHTALEILDELFFWKQE